MFKYNICAICIYLSICCAVAPIVPLALLRLLLSMCYPCCYYPCCAVPSLVLCLCYLPSVLPSLLSPVLCSALCYTSNISCVMLPLAPVLSPVLLYLLYLYCLLYSYYPLRLCPLSRSCAAVPAVLWAYTPPVPPLLPILLCYYSLLCCPSMPCLWPLPASLLPCSMPIKKRPARQG